jgi:hypothetical protein
MMSLITSSTGSAIRSLMSWFRTAYASISAAIRASGSTPPWMSALTNLTNLSVSCSGNPIHEVKTRVGNRIAPSDTA